MILPHGRKEVHKDGDEKINNWLWESVLYSAAYSQFYCILWNWTIQRKRQQKRQKCEFITDAKNFLNREKKEANNHKTHKMQRTGKIWSFNDNAHVVTANHSKGIKGERQESNVSEKAGIWSATQMRWSVLPFAKRARGRLTLSEKETRRRKFVCTQNESQRIKCLRQSILSELSQQKALEENWIPRHIEEAVMPNFSSV